MAQRSLNRVQLIGNLTRDPELRYTPQGTAVCTFGLATNRGWTTESGEKKESVEFHRLVSWNKLAELCSQLLSKGRKIFAEGRLQTRQWTGQDGAQRQTTEIVIDEMIILDSRRPEGSTGIRGAVVPAAGVGAGTKPVSTGTPAAVVADQPAEPIEVESTGNADKAEKEAKKEGADTKEVKADDIPF